MFDLKLFSLLIVISLPGIAFTIPSLMKSMLGIIEANLKKDQKMPSHLLLILASSFQAIVFVAIAAGIGVLTSSNTGLSTPYLTALLESDNSLGPFQQQFMAGVIGGAVCSVIFLPLYYGYFRPRLDKKTVKITENLRENMSFRGEYFMGEFMRKCLLAGA